MMRSTRQGSTRAESEEMTMQQVMGMMQSRAQPARVNEVTTGRKNQDRKRPYEARRPQARGAAEGDRQVRKGKGR